MSKGEMLKKVLILVVATLFLCGILTFLFAAEKEGLKLPAPGVQPKPVVVPRPGEKVKEKPKVGFILIDGTVTVPDGRSLGEVTIKLYEYTDTGGLRYGREVKTNKAGFYQFQLGEAYFNKWIKLVPKHLQFGEGENFSPRDDRFQITSVKMGNHNFRYIGPLPDLCFQGVRLYFDVAMVYVEAQIKNLGSLGAGPFSATVNVENTLSMNTETVFFDFLSLAGGSTEVKSQPIQASHGTNVRDWRVIEGKVDVFASVIESNEGNNRYIP